MEEAAFAVFLGEKSTGFTRSLVDLPHAPDRHSSVGGSALFDFEDWCVVPTFV